MSSPGETVSDTDKCNVCANVMFHSRYNPDPVIASELTLVLLTVMKDHLVSDSSNNSFSDLECLLNATIHVAKHPTRPGEERKESAFRCGNNATNHIDNDDLIVTSPTFLALKTVAGQVAGRLICWPDGKPPGPWTAFVSSRLGKNLDDRAAWFRALRVGCARLAEADSPVLNVVGTTASRFLPRATELFATPRIDVLIPKKALAPHEWWQSVQACPPKSRHTGTLYRAFLSPRFHLERAPEPTEEIDVNIAEADLIALRMANAFLALHVRHGGHVDQMLRHKLTGLTARTSPPVQLAIGANLNTQVAQEELLNAGAIGWYLYPSETTQGIAKSPPSVRAVTTVDAPQQLPNAIDSGRTNDRFLTHCTRRRSGPWPDQSSNAYLDDLILDRPGSDHSPLAALQRIVAGRRLIASGEGVRGGTAVVSFTSVPLDELQELRVFRSHRGRWDFEPYGICIRQSALQALADSPQGIHRLGSVKYGGEDDWQSLSSEERPFFQKSHSESKSGKIDWSAEQEWRFLGDIDLTQIQRSDAVFFVPAAEDVEELRELCPWPVIRLPTD